MWRQMAIENAVSKTLYLSIFDLRSPIVVAFSIAAYPVCIGTHWSVRSRINTKLASAKQWVQRERINLSDRLLINRIFECKIVNIFLPIRINISFWCPKEPSQWDGSFEYPQHMFWLRITVLEISQRTQLVQRQPEDKCNLPPTILTCPACTIHS